MVSYRLFERYYGIDYSGAKTPRSHLRGLQVFSAMKDKAPEKIKPYIDKNWNWTRNEVANWCAQQLMTDKPIIIGSDQAFSFPLSYKKRYSISNWDHFLDDFHKLWPTDQDNTSVESLRNDNMRNGTSDEFRLTENWTISAKSVFQFDMQGQVAKSSHAGIPWLRFLRNHSELSGKVHFWPFDGFTIPHRISVVVEVYPSIFRRRYTKFYPSGDEHDAYCITRWLQEMDKRGVLSQYFNPPLTKDEMDQAKLEGWIFGVY